jgi:hypothetical protein
MSEGRHRPTARSSEGVAARPEDTPPRSASQAPRRSERAVHDRGGRPTTERIDRSEHELADWELLVDALLQTLARAGVMTVDELRRGIESMPPDEYERAGYYERWLRSIETILAEKGIVTGEEVDARL